MGPKLGSRFFTRRKSLENQHFPPPPQLLSRWEPLRWFESSRRPLSEFRGDSGVTAPTLSSATSLIPTTALRVPRRMRCLSLTPHVPRPQPRHHGRMRHASAFVELGDACVNSVDASALGIAVASDRFSRVQFRTASLHRYTSFRSPIFTTTTISWSSRIW